MSLPPSPDGRVLTCVLADDHDGIRGATRAQLDRLGWVEVVAEAADGDAAVAAIAGVRPDVAVVDVQMPGRSGIEVCAHLAEQGLPTEIVLFTAVPTEANVELARRAGAAALVAKDEGFAPLRSVLEAIRSRGAAASGG
ncbi:MAG: two-component system response regulator [Thermoleophilia bacterium]|nr:two-component system response regulator [Thermoleophilia bacterium]